MKLAFIFPGQGSQCVGMAKEFIENFEESRAVFETAGSVLGYDPRVGFEEGLRRTCDWYRNHHGKPADK